MFLILQFRHWFLANRMRSHMKWKTAVCTFFPLHFCWQGVCCFFSSVFLPRYPLPIEMHSSSWGSPVQLIQLLTNMRQFFGVPMEIQIVFIVVVESITPIGAWCWLKAIGVLSWITRHSGKSGMMYVQNESCWSGHHWFLFIFLSKVTLQIIMFLATVLARKRCYLFDSTNK